MVTKELNFDKMSLEQLQELFELDAEIQSSQVDDVLAELLETSFDIVGKKGRGKTLNAVAIAYQMRQRFGRNVICVGSKMGIGQGSGGPNAFGPYQFMSELDFRNEMERLSVAADEEENAAKVAEMFEKYGISILYSTLVFDEAYKLFEARRSSDKLVQLVGYFMAQQRHYHVTTIILVPDEDMLDKRVIRQLDWKGRAYHNKYTDICRTRFTQGLKVMTLEVDGLDDTMHPAYYSMYDTHNLLGYRKASLQLKQE